MDRLIMCCWLYDVYYVSTGYGSGGSGVVVVVREGAAGI